VPRINALDDVREATAFQKVIVVIAKFWYLLQDNVTVLVVVFAVARYFVRVGPHQHVQVLVADIDTIVDDRYNDGYGFTPPEQFTVRPLGADAHHAIGFRVEVMPVGRLGLSG
jgi:hypothetical protein